MTKLLFVDDGISFDSYSIRDKPYGGRDAFVSLVNVYQKMDLKLLFTIIVNMRD